MPQVPFAQTDVTSDLLMTIVSAAHTRIPNVLGHAIGPNGIHRKFDLAKDGNADTDPAGTARAGTAVEIGTRTFRSFFVSEFVFYVAVVCMGEGLYRVGSDVSICSELGKSAARGGHHGCRLVDLPPLGSGLSRDRDFMTGSGGMDHHVLWWFGRWFYGTRVGLHYTYYYLFEREIELFVSTLPVVGHYFISLWTDVSGSGTSSTLTVGYY